MANGCNQNPIGECSEAEGINTTANGTASHAEGINTIANGAASHAEGSTTTAGGNATHTEGYDTATTADTAHAEVVLKLSGKLLTPKEVQQKQVVLRPTQNGQVQQPSVRPIILICYIPHLLLVPTIQAYQQ